MAIASGLAGSIGVAAETTYGTYVAPTRFYEYNSETLGKTKNTVQGGGLAAGRLARLASRRVLTNEAGSGSISLELSNTKLGLLLQHLTGSSAAPVVQGATAAYLQTHALTDNVGKFLTIQKGVPDLTGVVRPYTFRGAKITAAEFSCEVNGIAMCSFDVDARQVSEAETYAAPSIPTGAVAPFHFQQMSVKIGTLGSEVAVAGIKGLTLRVERPQNTERYYANAAGLKAEPMMNDFAAVSGTFTTDLVDKTAFADRFASDASFSLVWEFTGPLIASTFPYLFRVRVPATFVNDGTPQVGGPDIVSPAFSFEGQSDGTNPLVTIEYQTTDTTV